MLLFLYNTYALVDRPAPLACEDIGAGQTGAEESQDII